MDRVTEKLRRIERSLMVFRQAVSSKEMESSPLLRDLSIIQDIYKILEENKKGHVTANDRKVFIFVVVYLYAPSKLLGGKMPQGMRKAISKTMGVNSSYISRTCTELKILYSTYSDFRQEVDRLLSAVLSVNL